MTIHYTTCIVKCTYVLGENTPISGLWHHSINKSAILWFSKVYGVVASLLCGIMEFYRLRPGNSITMEPLLTITSDEWPPCLQWPLTLVQTASPFIIVLPICGHLSTPYYGRTFQPQMMLINANDLVLQPAPHTH